MLLTFTPRPEASGNNEASWPRQTTRPAGLIDQEAHMPIFAKLDELGKPAWIALMILGFVIWWPVGLATLAFIIGSGRMSCWKRSGMSRWHGAADEMRHAGTWWQPSRSSGNRAFTTIARKPCGASKRSNASFTTFSVACAWPRTKPSSINSWPIVVRALARQRRRRRTEVHRFQGRSGRPPFGVGGPICARGKLPCGNRGLSRSGPMRRGTGGSCALVWTPLAGKR